MHGHAPEQFLLELLVCGNSRGTELHAASAGNLGSSCI